MCASTADSVLWPYFVGRDDLVRGNGKQDVRNTERYSIFTEKHKVVDGFSNCLIELESAHHSPGRKPFQSGAYGSVIISFTSMCVVPPHTVRSKRAMMTLLSFTPSSLTTVTVPLALSGSLRKCQMEGQLGRRRIRFHPGMDYSGAA